MLPVAVEMQTARDQFLASAAFPLDQNGTVSVGDFIDEIVNLLHLPARADDVLEAITILQLLPQINVLPQGRLIIERALHRHLQLVDLKRLGHVIIRAYLHRFDRRLDRGVGRDQNHRRLPMMLAHMPQHVEPGHGLHLDVRDHHLRLNVVELLNRLRPRIEWENLVPLLAAKRNDDLHHGRLVIDNHDLGHKISARRIFQN